jgi:hypothetical protein
MRTISFVLKIVNGLAKANNCTTVQGSVGDGFVCDLIMESNTERQFRVNLFSFGG